MIARRWALLLALLGMPDAGSGAASEPQAVVIGVGPVAGFSFPLGGELCRLYETSANDQGHCYVAATSGSVEALDRLRSGELTFAIVQSDLAADAVAAQGAFVARPPFADLRSVAGFYADALTILVRSDGPVKHVADLRGKRVAVGEPGAPDPLFADLLDSLGWTKADLGGVIEMTRSDQFAALCNGKIAAIALTAPHPNGFVRQALSACPVTMLDLAGPGIDSIVTAHRGYGPARVDLGAYGRASLIALSFGPRAVLVTRADVGDEPVKSILAAIVHHLDDLRTAHPAFAGVDLETVATGNGLGAARHPAASQYFADSSLAPPAKGE